MQQTIEFDQTVDVFADQLIKVNDSSISIQLPQDFPEDTKLTISRVDHSDAAGDVIDVDLQLPQQEQEDFEGSYVLTLAVDEDFIDKEIAIFYFDEEIEKWENIGGEVNVHEQTISTTVTHFSTYGVFVLEEDPSEPDDNNGSEDETDQDDETVLPSTATNLFNLLAIGGLMMIIGISIMILRRKQNT